MDLERSQIEQAQRESLTEIGAHLQQLRLRKEQTVEDVARQIRIRPALIRAIEEGQLQRLPEAVYIRGFIKRYADLMGEDGEAYAEAFPANLIRAKYSFWRAPAIAQLRPLHLYCAYVLLIVAAVGGLSYMLENSQADRSEQPSPLDTALLPTEPAPSAAPQAPEATSPQTATDAKPVRVKVLLTAQSWLRIVVDGSTEFEGVLPEGTQQDWSADSAVTVRAGNAGGVMVSYNGQEAQQLGEPGSVEEITFSADQAVQVETLWDQYALLP